MNSLCFKQYMMIMMMMIMVMMMVIVHLYIAVTPCYCSMLGALGKLSSLLPIGVT